MAWQVQEAKQRFSELVRSALTAGPQFVTRRGERVVVVLAADEYERLTSDVQDFKDFLLSGPDLGGLEIRRSRETAREVSL